MAHNKLSDIVLEKKKDKVIEVVLKVCDTYKLKVPKINFNGCPQETQDQLAHYHPDLHKICISEHQLHKQNLNGIESTAYHEIAHSLVQDHGGKFKRMKAEMGTATWRPPPGVVYIIGDDKKRVNQEEKEEVEDKICCNYHLCRKKRKLQQCILCKRYFCDEHIKPVLPGAPSIGDKEPDYHPCPAYVDFVKDQREGYREALEQLVQQNYTFSGEEASKDKEEQISKPREVYSSTPTKKMSNKEIQQARKKLGITTEPALSDKEMEEITRKTYENYNTGFGTYKRQWNKDGKEIGSKETKRAKPKADKAKQEPLQKASNKKKRFIDRIKGIFGVEM